jgi:hypothetical protein
MQLGKDLSGVPSAVCSLGSYAPREKQASSLGCSDSVLASLPLALPANSEYNPSMSSDPCCEQPPPEMAVAIKEFNLGLFFECHETLEDLWMAEPRPIRHFYQGILQIGVAFHHLKRARYRPVCTLLTRGAGYLEPFAPACMGVDVAHLRESAAHCLAEVERLGPNNLDQFDWSLIPTIDLTDFGNHPDGEGL